MLLLCSLHASIYHILFDLQTQSNATPLTDGLAKDFTTVSTGNDTVSDYGTDFPTFPHAQITPML